MLNKWPLMLWGSANRVTEKSSEKGHVVISFEEFRACKVCDGDWDGEHDERCPIPWLLEWSGVTVPGNWEGFEVREALDKLV